MIQSRRGASYRGPHVVPRCAMLQVVGVAEVPEFFKLATSLLLVLRWQTIVLMALERGSRGRSIDPHVVSLEKIAVPDERFGDFASGLVARPLTLDRSMT